MKRYLIYDGSTSAHCCFTATIVDTKKPLIIGGEHYIDEFNRLFYESVCECFNVEDAMLICDLLNGKMEDK